MAYCHPEFGCDCAAELAELAEYRADSDVLHSRYERDQVRIRLLEAESEVLRQAASERDAKDHNTIVGLNAVIKEQQQTILKLRLAGVKEGQTVELDSPSQLWRDLG